MTEIKWFTLNELKEKTLIKVESLPELCLDQLLMICSLSWMVIDNKKRKADMIKEYIESTWMRPDNGLNMVIVVNAFFEYAKVTYYQDKKNDIVSAIGNEKM